MSFFKYYLSIFFIPTFIFGMQYNPSTQPKDTETEIDDHDKKMYALHTNSQAEAEMIKKELKENFRAVHQMQVESAKLHHKIEAIGKKIDDLQKKLDDKLK